MAENEIEYRVRLDVTSADLNGLFARAWDHHAESDFGPVLRHSLSYICAYAGEQLVGFVNVAWDGGIHAFLLDTTVDPAWQRRGIGRELVSRAANEARTQGMEWLHVDYEPEFETFYRQCGFQPTLAGLIQLSEK